MSKVPRKFVLLAICGLSLCLAVSGIGLAVQDGDSQATIRTNADTTNYLQPAETTGQQYQEVSIDVAAALDSSAQELHTAAEMRSFDRQLQFASDLDRRVEIAKQRLAVVERRYRSIDQRRATLFEQYSAGELSATALASELVRLKTAVETQEQYRARIDSEVFDDTSASPATEFLQDFESLEQSMTVRQPVTDRLRTAMIGSRDPIVVYTNTAADALVLATIDGNTYYRQATVRAERNLAGDDQFVDGFRSAYNRIETLYPWVLSSSNLQLSPLELRRFSQVYAIRAVHSHGEMTMYLDGATRNVFHETHRKPLTVQPVSATVTSQNDSLNVTAQFTNRAGPMQLRVRNLAGVPVEDADVAVDGMSVGRTDAEGELWLVQPAEGSEIGISTAANESVSVAVPG